MRQDSYYNIFYYRKILNYAFEIFGFSYETYIFTIKQKVGKHPKKMKYTCIFNANAYS